MPCVSCENRWAVGLVLLDGDEVALCGVCLQDASALGLAVSVVGAS